MMSKRHTGSGAPHGRERTLAELREALLTRRQQLLASVRQEWRDLHHQPLEASGEALGDLGDRRTLTVEAEVAYELMGSRAHVLGEIDRSLEKIDRGTYGLCEDCEEPIAARRLRVVPFALRCVGCQERVERTVGPCG
jgi:DnaK suppressor protein